MKQQSVSFPSMFPNMGSLPREKRSRRERSSFEDVKRAAKVEPVQGWRGLDLDMLRSRVQRLSVLLELSEPGTIPDAGMLASLVDMVRNCLYVA